MTPAALAAAVRARHVRQAALVSPPAMSLLERGAPVTLQVVQKHDHFLAWAPRLRFDVAGERTRETPVARVTVPGAARREQLESVVRRIVTQVQRVEGSPRHRDSAPATAGSQPGRARVQLPQGPRFLVPILHTPRTSAVTPEVASGASSPPSALDGPDGSRSTGWPPPRPKPAPLATVEVERLTDQVVQAIGRRVSAYRERRGR